jgi:hypothetical protein
MSRSSNGWPVLTSSADPKLTVIRIPNTGTPGIPLRLHKDCAAVLAYVAGRVHKEVSDLRENNVSGKTQDEGGYNYRKIDGTSRFSNHASGTAMDLNWQKWPMGRKAMTKKQRTAALLIAEDLEEVIRWGGTYRSRVDEMHWEIRPGVTLADVKKFIKARGIDKYGKVKTTTTKTQPKKEDFIRQCRAI